MLDAGAIEGEDMLPEVALVKLMWVLANAKVRKMSASLDEDASCQERYPSPRPSRCETADQGQTL